ncbi:DUF302 domain-containing protein [Desulfurella sp.]|uniref:DUF302 domain-containing protein n=1 Tax=Desulfurella sp. TaxID=1962857 RepID=UPI003D11A9C7
MKLIDRKVTKENKELLIGNLKEESLKEGFSILSEYNFNTILEKKGFQTDKKAYILEICNPSIAKEVLFLDPIAGINLPCKLGVFEKDDGYHVIYMDPESLAEDKHLKIVLASISRSLNSIVDKAMQLN